MSTDNYLICGECNESRPPSEYSEQQLQQSGFFRKCRTCILSEENQMLQNQLEQYKLEKSNQSHSKNKDIVNLINDTDEQTENENEDNDIDLNNGNNGNNGNDNNNKNNINEDEDEDSKKTTEQTTKSLNNNNKDKVGNPHNAGVILSVPDDPDNTATAKPGDKEQYINARLDDLL